MKCLSLLIFVTIFSAAVPSRAMETAVIQPGFFAAESEQNFFQAREYTARGALKNLQTMYNQGKIFALPENVTVEIAVFDSRTMTCLIGIPQSGIYYWTDIEAVKPGYRNRKVSFQADSAEQRYTLQQNFFRIKYFLKGEHAVPAADTNKNGIPDFVEDVALQLRVAHYVFCELSGFRSPFKSARYPNLAYVDVFIYNRSTLENQDGLVLSSTFRLNGLAVSSSRFAGDPVNPAARSLLICLASDFDPKKSLTPTHEYFHLIQNSMSQLKNRWYFEGMARWSEDSLGNRKQDTLSRSDLITMMENPAEQAELFAMSYNAAQKLWIPLANLCPDTSVSLPTDNPILNLKYSDGTRVMQDRIFMGARLMSAVLDGLAAIENVPFTAHNYGRWTEENRRDEKNNLYILRAIRQAMDKVCPHM